MTAPLPNIIKEEFDVQTWESLRHEFRGHVQDLADLGEMLADRGFSLDAILGLQGVQSFADAVRPQFKDTTTYLDGGLTLDEI